VVIDKKSHHDRYAHDLWNPCSYLLGVMLNRVRGLIKHRTTESAADVMPESRAKREDRGLQQAYSRLLHFRAPYRTAEDYREVFPDEKLKFCNRSMNVADLQIADLVASGQKLQILRSNGMPLSAVPSEFTLQVDDAIAHLGNRYGAVFIP